MSRDGGTLVALDEREGSITIISLDDGRPVGPAEILPDRKATFPAPALAVSDDGSLAAVQQSDGTVRVFDGATGNPIGVTIPYGVASGALAFGPDGDWLAILSVMGPPGVLATEDVPTAGLVVVDPLTGDRLGPERVGTIAVDNDRVAVAGNGIIRVHDAASGRPTAGPLAQPTAVTSLAFATGNRLVTGAVDGWRVWDLEAPRQQGPAVAGGGRVDALAVIGQGDVVTAGAGGQAVISSLEALPVIGSRLGVPFAGFFAPQPVWNNTVLAPTDEAFDALPGEVLEGLKQDRDRLTRVLQHHVALGYLESRSLEPGESLSSATTV